MVETLSIYRLKVSIKHLRPPVWRRLEVAGDTTFAAFHEVLQRAFGWTDSHLHQFVVEGGFIGPSDLDEDGWGPPVRDERRLRLGPFLGERVRRFVYEYDFGDGWEHEVVVEKVLPADPGVRYPRCTAGRRACPPEDSGGPWGYVELLAAVNDPTHPDAEHLREWLGEDFDSEAFDLAAVNAALAPRRPRPRRSPVAG